MNIYLKNNLKQNVKKPMAQKILLRRKMNQNQNIMNYGKIISSKTQKIKINKKLRSYNYNNI